MLALRSAVLATLVALLLGACSDDPAPAATTTTAEPTTTTTEPAAPELLDAGAEPRSVLRLSLAEGQRSELRHTTDVRVDQTVDGVPQGFDTPPISQLIDLEVEAVTDDRAELAIEVLGVEVRPEGTGLTPEEVAQLEAGLGEIGATQGTAVLRTDGRVEDLAYDGDAAAPVLDAVGAPLPDDPVGVGARWRRTTRTEALGVVLDTTSTYTLTEVTEDRIAFDVEVEMVAADQEVQLGSDEPLPAQLLELSLTGGGQGTIDRVGPGHTLQVRVEGTESLEVDGRRVEQRIVLAQSIRTREAI